MRANRFRGGLFVKAIVGLGDKPDKSKWFSRITDAIIWCQTNKNGLFAVVSELREVAGSQTHVFLWADGGVHETWYDNGAELYAAEFRGESRDS